MGRGSVSRRKPGSSRPPARQDDPKAFAASVGEAVRRARQSLAWTQAKLAEQAGFSPNYIARLERGELGPSFFVAHQLCEALGIDAGALLSDAGPATRTRRRVVG